MLLDQRTGDEHVVMSFIQPLAEELLVWDGIVCRNINTNIAESWMMNQSNTFDQEIMEAMHFRRWLDIKACLKQNSFWEERRKQMKDMIRHRSTA